MCRLCGSGCRSRLNSPQTGHASGQVVRCGRSSAHRQPSATARAGDGDNRYNNPKTAPSMIGARSLLTRLMWWRSGRCAPRWGYVRMPLRSVGSP